MPVSVHLSFVPPEREGFTKLHIFEAPNATDPLAAIEEVTVIGVYPDYISEYTTNMATAIDDWFSIQWEDDKGAKTPITARIKGGTETLVGQVVRRVMERDRSLPEVVVVQEVEGAIEYVFNKDPYTVDAATDIIAGRKYRMLTGLVYLAMARTYLSESAQTQDVQQATIGLISFKTATGSSRTVDVGKLIDLANGLLGISTSIVLQIESLEVGLWENVLEP